MLNENKRNCYWQTFVRLRIIELQSCMCVLFLSWEENEVGRVVFLIRLGNLLRMYLFLSSCFLGFSRRATEQYYVYWGITCILIVDKLGKSFDEKKRHKKNTTSQLIIILIITYLDTGSRLAVWSRRHTHSRRRPVCYNTGGHTRR